MNENAIRTEDVPQCPLCGNEERKILYTGLRDRLFGAPGEWTLKECCRCELVFMDPRPTEDEIGKAYKTYGSHRREPEPAPTSTPLRWFRRVVHNGYLEWKFGYRRPDNLAWGRKLAALAYLHPVGRATLDSVVMYLPAPAPGARVLEVGCGNGRHLERLREWGWAVEGVEPDAQAVEVARSQGLTVHQGDLASQCFAEGTFDAVIVSHVIEHVHDPVALMRECGRVLRPGGILVVITPNVRSVVHRFFKSSAFHLDPPRHLVLFQPQTLAQVADQPDMHILYCAATAVKAKDTFLRTLDIQRHGFVDLERQVGLLENLAGWAYHIMQRIIVKFRKDVGEEILLIARKNART